MNEPTSQHKLAGALLCLSLLALPAVAATGPVPDPVTQAIAPADPQALQAEPSAAVAASTPTSPTTGEVFTAPACNYLQETSRRDVRYVITGFPPRIVPLVTTTSSAETRPSLAIGVNDYGSFGLTDAGVATGFQMPAGAANENLAVGWWGEGYLINVHDSAGGPNHLTTYYPSGPNVGDVQRIDDFYLDSGRYVTYRVTVAVDAGEGAGDVLVDFEFTLDTERCDVMLRTTMLNQSDRTVDIEYDRAVDWDNLDHSQAATGLFFGTDWRIDGSSIVASRELASYGFSTPTSTVWVTTSYECRTTALGTTMPYAYDIDSWDDLTTVGPGWNHVTAPQSVYDGNAGFSYERNGLAPGAAWDTFLLYSCSYFTTTVTKTLGDIDRVLDGLEIETEALAPLLANPRHIVLG